MEMDNSSERTESLEDQIAEMAEAVNDENLATQVSENGAWAQPVLPGASTPVTVTKKRGRPVGSKNKAAKAPTVGEAKS